MDSARPRILRVDARRPAAAAIAETVKALKAGKLVVLPTETVYGLAGHPAARDIEDRIFEAKTRDRGKPIPLLAYDLDAVERSGAVLGPRARRLALRFWPGPLTLVLPCGERTEGFRVPDHAVARAVLKASGGLLRVTSANVSGSPAALDAAAAAEALGPAVSLVLDAGPVKLGVESTVVRAVGDELQILRRGAVAEKAIEGRFLVLFVCTGNICRSPMAEALMRHWLGPESEWQVASAGVAAMDGQSASPEAQAVIAEKGLDLSTHRSQPLDEALVDAADVIVVMTESHRQIVRQCFPSAASRVFLLNAFSPLRRGESVPDPVGMSTGVYRTVRDEIDAAMPDLVLHLRDRMKR